MSRRIGVAAVSLVSAAIFVALLGPRAGLTIFAVLALHETGHAVAAWLFTRRAPAVMVMPAFFGLTIAPGVATRPAADRVAYNLAGSWGSSVVALALLPLAVRSDWVFSFAWALLLVNVVNVLPIPGTDGGRVSWLLTATLPWRWRVGVTGLLVAVGFALAYWLRLPLVWIAWSVNSVVLLPLTWMRKDVPSALAPRAAVAWSVVHVVTVTALLHALWVMLSMGDPLSRLQRGLAL